MLLPDLHCTITPHYNVRKLKTILNILVWNKHTIGPNFPISSLSSIIILQGSTYFHEWQSHDNSFHSTTSTLAVLTYLPLNGSTKFDNTDDFVDTLHSLSRIFISSPITVNLTYEHFFLPCLIWLSTQTNILSKFLHITVITETWTAQIHSANSCETVYTRIKFKCKFGMYLLMAIWLLSSFGRAVKQSTILTWSTTAMALSQAMLSKINFKKCYDY